MEKPSRRHKEAHVSIQPNSWRWSRSAGRPARLPCSSCCRRRCTSIYTVPTLDTCFITSPSKTLSKSWCLTHPFCSSSLKTAAIRIWSPRPRLARARANMQRFSYKPRPAGFEIQPFLSIHYGYTTGAEHRTNLIDLWPGISSPTHMCGTSPACHIHKS